MQPGYAGTQGHAPTVLIQPIPPKSTLPTPSTSLSDNPEKDKYLKLWDHKEYREVSPGEKMAMMFLDQARVVPDSECIDFGCGTGRGAVMLSMFGKMKVLMLDFAANCLDSFVVEACQTQPDRIKFAEQDLTKPIQYSAPYGYCCDVMEHIPTDIVPLVLRNILSSSQHVFFGISTVHDQMGALIGETLHLTVQPLQWWLQKLSECGAVVHWTHEQPGYCAVYCSAWNEASNVIVGGRLNVDVETIEKQVETNLRAGWTHVKPHEKTDREVVFLAGGPSMTSNLSKIKELRESGCALVTTNGAYQWAIEQGLKPSAQIVLDAREFNKRFVEPQQDQCRYLIASQAHPATLENLPRERTFLWHAGISIPNIKLLAELQIPFFPIPGGSTVVLRAIPLLRMLGYWRLHMFGFDSCVLPDGTHHAYPQAENDRQPVVPVSCGGRVFECVPWMVSQASEFRDLVGFMGNEVELAVYGDGLISQMIATGASLSTDFLNED